MEYILKVTSLILILSRTRKMHMKTFKLKGQVLPSEQ